MPMWLAVSLGYVAFFAVSFEIFNSKLKVGEQTSLFLFEHSKCLFYLSLILLLFSIVIFRFIEMEFIKISLKAGFFKLISIFFICPAGFFSLVFLMKTRIKE